MESLRTPLFLVAAALLAVAVLLELGSPLANRLTRGVRVAAAEIDKVWRARSDCCRSSPRCRRAT